MADRAEVSHVLRARRRSWIGAIGGGYSMTPRLVVCQIRAQTGGANDVCAGHGIAGEGL
jgi:hypothetical protein